MIQHQVNHHTRYRDVQPQRQRPTRNSLVALKISSFSAPNRHDDEGYYHCGEKGMRKKYGEIYRPHDSLPREFRYAVMRVVDDIRDKKKHRRR